MSAMSIPPPRIAALVSVIGVLVLLTSAGFSAWALWWAKAPGLDRLEHVMGRVKSATLLDVQGAGRTLRLVVDRDGSDYELTLPQADQLRERDWPLESVRAGDRVVAWYTPDTQTKSRGMLWQLHRGHLRVVALEDTGALYRERCRHVLPVSAFGLLAGAAMIAVGRVRRKRAAAPD